MAGWKRVLRQITGDAEDHFRALRQHLRQQLSLDDPVMIVPYRSYGTSQEFFLKGRVLEDHGITASRDNDTLWDNLVNAYRRFESDEVAGARVVARFQGQSYEAVTDAEGFFELRIRPQEPLSNSDQLWHQVELELLEPLRADGVPVRATAEVLVPPASARFGVISDIDDTIVHTDVANQLKMAREVFLGNARTRLPFPGVAAFYRALHNGINNESNPIFCVSSSPWNLYDLLTEFFDIHTLPRSVLLLRDWSGSRSMAVGHHGHKISAIHPILEMYPHLPFVLIGDSGQHDPEIYHDVVRNYPGRILAVYIRHVNRSEVRTAEVQRLGVNIEAMKSMLLLADDTLAAARHAMAHGWISASMLPLITGEKAADSAPAGPVERLLDEGV